MNYTLSSILHSSSRKGILSTSNPPKKGRINQIYSFFVYIDFYYKIIIIAYRKIKKHKNNEKVFYPYALRSITRQLQNRTSTNRICSDCINCLNQCISYVYNYGSIKTLYHRRWWTTKRRHHKKRGKKHWRSSTIPPGILRDQKTSLSFTQRGFF